MNIITLTGDGSNTLYNEEIGEHYHSKHGAFQESKHVFLDAGLKRVLEINESAQESAAVSILEVGFGTGLNFLLTLDYCRERQVCLDYHSIEAYPLDNALLEETGYEQFVSQDTWTGFLGAYNKALTGTAAMGADRLSIHHLKLNAFESAQQFDLVYYDAFSVQHQPEMWTDEIIHHTCMFLKPGGIFVTYAITGKLKRALKAIGFSIEKLPGAPGKREMLRAVKS